MTVVPAAPFRLARGSAVAVVGLALAFAGHGLAAGHVGAGAGTVLPALAVLAGCIVAAQRAWTLGRLVTALLAVQLAVHGSLWLTAGGQQVDPRLAALVTTAATHHHATASAALTPGMLAAHAAALLVAAALLAGVDDAVLRIWALGRGVLGALPVPTGLRHGTAVRRAGAVRSRPGTRAGFVPQRRGPPALPAPC
jgi:hypothetical protein